MTPEQPLRRSNCPISFSLEIFGDRWTLLVLRDLLLKGKRHYREFLAAEEGIASNILADRLKRLEAKGILRREPDPKDGRQVIYRATEIGMSLIPTLLEIAYWGAKHDAQTGAPARFAKGFEENRDEVIADFVENAKRG